MTEPSVGPPRVAAATAPVLQVEDLRVEYSVTDGAGRRGRLRAVDGVSMTVGESETVGIVGESGCGKSTLARAVLLLTPATSGRITYRGTDLTQLSPSAMRHSRRHLQMVFQDPASSLDPRVPVWAAVTEPLRIHDRISRRQARARAPELLDMVGLAARFADRLPHELSGGQRQRVAIARALALHPSLVVCDEAVSALDVSVRAQVVNLLVDLQQRLGLAYLFIGHDLGIVRYVSDRILVMYLGQVVESIPSERLSDQALHPYTRTLLSAVPRSDVSGSDSPDRLLAGGELPSPTDPPSGCRFRTRCPLAQQRCAELVPELAAPGWVADGAHLVACHRAEELRGVPVSSLTVPGRVDANERP